MEHELVHAFVDRVKRGMVDYLDVLPVSQPLSSRVRIRRSSLGGGTFRVGYGGFLLRPGLRLGLSFQNWNRGGAKDTHTAAMSSIEFVLYALRALALANCTRNR